MQDLLDLQARLDRLWADPDSLRLQSWFRRTWVRLARRGDEVQSSAIEEFAQLGGQGHEWLRHRQSILDELTANTVWIEDHARSDDEIDGVVLSWLHDLASWATAMDQWEERPVFSARYSLMKGLGSRALQSPGSGLPTRLIMSVDSICREAAEECELLYRREALLRAAQRMLLNAAALVEEPALGSRYDGICEELRQLKRMARVVDPAVSIDFQIREAAKRGNRQVLRGLSTVRAYMRAGANSPNKSAGSEITAGLAAELAESREPDELPQSVSEAIKDGYVHARTRLDTAIENAPPMQRNRLQGYASDLKTTAESAFFRMTRESNAAFDVGESLQQERYELVQELREAVSYPTETLAISPVTKVSDIAHALIEDPRLLLYHFASRRLLQRRFIQNRTRRRRSGAIRASVRFYLLDGSSSMRGPRGRMRDALFVAELASLVERLEQPAGRVRSLLFYRYFAADAEVTRRVATAAEALSTIRTVFDTQRTGGTDIQSALLESLALIEAQRDNDVELSRAQIVLVTDGQADVDPDMLRRAQEQLSIPVRVSIIALGAENPALRRFAAEQRNAGLEVVYQHVGDDALLERDTQERAPRPDFGGPRPSLSSLSSLSSPSAYEGPSDEGEDLEYIVAALQELGLSEDDLSPSRRRTLETQRAGQAALSRRFDALFPRLQPRPKTVDIDLDSTDTTHLLMVVLEILTCTPTTGWRMQSDAVAIMERLLRDHGMSKAAYTEALGVHAGVLVGVMEEIRALAGMGSGA